MSGFLVLHYLAEFAQTHAHWVSDAIQRVSDAIQPSHHLLSPSPPAFNLSQHQGLCQWIGSSRQVAKALELQLQSFIQGNKLKKKCGFKWKYRGPFCLLFLNNYLISEVYVNIYWSWSSNTLVNFGQLTHWKRPWCWERWKAEGEGGNRGWEDWMASPTRWTWVWANSGRWWRTGKTGMLQSTG